MNYKYIKQTDENAKVIEIKLKNNDGYCPCSLIKNEDTKCICKSFREGKQVEEGLCHCGLFLRTKK